MLHPGPESGDAMLQRSLTCFPGVWIHPVSAAKPPVAAPLRLCGVLASHEPSGRRLVASLPCIKGCHAASIPRMHSQGGLASSLAARRLVAAPRCTILL